MSRFSQNSSDLPLPKDVPDAVGPPLSSPLPIPVEQRSATAARSTLRYSLVPHITPPSSPELEDTPSPPAQNGTLALPLLMEAVLALMLSRLNRESVDHLLFYFPPLSQSVAISSLFLPSHPEDSVPNTSTVVPSSSSLSSSIPPTSSLIRPDSPFNSHDINLAYDL